MLAGGTAPVTVNVPSCINGVIGFPIESSISLIWMVTFVVPVCNPWIDRVANGILVDPFIITCPVSNAFIQQELAGSVPLL